MPTVRQKRRSGNTGWGLYRLDVATDLRSALMVSIRGRFAFALVCIERSASLLAVQSPALNELLETLWDFTSSMDLGQWESEVLARVTPMLAAIDGANAQEDALSTLPAPLRRQLYDAVEEVGRGNLYGGVVGVSEATLNGTWSPNMRSA